MLIALAAKNAATTTIADPLIANPKKVKALASLPFTMSQLLANRSLFAAIPLENRRRS